MDLETYLESIRRGVQNATALADDQTRSVAERLGATLDDAGRLALIAALSDAAAEISRDLSPGSVELRMAGTRPEFVVTPAPGHLAGADDHDDEDEHTGPAEEQQVAADADEPTARITLRLPVSVKAKVDEAAAAEGLSANAWLMRTVLSGLSGHHRGPRPPRPPRPPRGPFGPEGFLGADGPFGAEGVFGPDGPFGPEGVFGPKARETWEGWEGKDGRQGRDKRRGGRGRGKRVTGWAE
jgi:hypothetical protein